MMTLTPLLMDVRDAFEYLSCVSWVMGNTSDDEARISLAQVQKENLERAIFTMQTFQTRSRGLGSTLLNSDRPFSLFISEFLFNVLESENYATSILNFTSAEELVSYQPSHRRVDPKDLRQYTILSLIDKLSGRHDRLPADNQQSVRLLQHKLGEMDQVLQTFNELALGEISDNERSTALFDAQIMHYTLNGFQSDFIPKLNKGKEAQYLADRVTNLLAQVNMTMSNLTASTPSETVNTPPETSSIPVQEKLTSYGDRLEELKGLEGNLRNGGDVEVFRRSLNELDTDCQTMRTSMNTMKDVSSLDELYDHLNIIQEGVVDLTRAHCKYTRVINYQRVYC